MRGGEPNETPLRVPSQDQNNDDKSSGDNTHQVQRPQIKRIRQKVGRQARHGAPLAVEHSDAAHERVGLFALRVRRQDMLDDVAAVKAELHQNAPGGTKHAQGELRSVLEDVVMTLQGNQK